mmetsp:Transcript_64071/g.144516  ORF Transcript_64071/g.144516 Transcript_64071/m.144516 type:complete len:335 (+) Transcript_64071:61-1065(+)
MARRTGVFTLLFLVSTSALQGALKPRGGSIAANSPYGSARHAGMRRVPFSLEASSSVDPSGRDDESATYKVSELKRSLVGAAAEFKAAQKEQWRLEDSARASGEPSSYGGAGAQKVEQLDERVKSPLAAEAFGNIEVGLGTARLAELRNATVDRIRALSSLAPPDPGALAAWRTPQGAASCEMHGRWKLLFTTGADATFRPKPGEAPPVAYQEIDAVKGYFVNCVDFPEAKEKRKGKLAGFRVFVKGIRMGLDEVELKFRRVELRRPQSRLFFLRKIVLLLPPSGLLRALSRWASKGKGQTSPRGAGFKLLFLDGDLRCHVTFDGQYFVQTRIE